MPKLSEITVDISADTDNLVAKLRAISKHTLALVEELEGIDNAWKCEHCGHDTWVTVTVGGQPYYDVCERCTSIKRNN